MHLAYGGHRSIAKTVPPITFEGITMKTFITSADAIDEISAIDLAIKAIKAMP